MKNKSFGFIGGGRITRIILERLKNVDSMPDHVNICETSKEVSELLSRRIGNTASISDDPAPALRQDIVFLALHPPILVEALDNAASQLSEKSIVISLAPALTIKQISERLNGFDRIVRFIPNAPSIIGEGFNPIVFSPSLTPDEKSGLLSVFSHLGDCPEVKEETLEAYAVLTAMGPTYLWFQFQELVSLGSSFKLEEDAARTGIARMVEGSVKTWLKSGLSTQEILDLIPVKPIMDEEETIKNIYQSKLTALFGKISPK